MVFLNYLFHTQNSQEAGFALAADTVYLQNLPLFRRVQGDNRSFADGRVGYQLQPRRADLETGRLEGSGKTAPTKTAVVE